MPSLPFVGHWELVALIVVLGLLFGSKHIPSAARMLGRGVREVREPLRETRAALTLEAPEDEAESQK